MSSKVKLTDAIKAISNNTSETLVKKPVTKKKNDKKPVVVDEDEIVLDESKFNETFEVGKKKGDVTYKKLQLHEQILLRPDTYIGSCKNILSSDPIYVKVGDKIKEKNITYPEGLVRLFVEAVSNAIDNTWRSLQEGITPKFIKINITDNKISVWNDGKNIPLDIHPEEKVPIPELIFGNLLTSSNYNDNEERKTSGKNGLGIKCISPDTNIPLWEGEIRKANEIVVGDKLIGDDGTVRTVKNVVEGRGKMYRIEQSLGETYEVNEHHILTLHMPDHKVIFWNNTTKCWNVLYWDKTNMKICKTQFRAIEKDKNECSECGIYISSNMDRHMRRVHPEKPIVKKQRKSPMTEPPNTKEVIDARIHIEEFCKNIPDDYGVFDISIQDYLKLDKTTQGRLAGIRAKSIDYPKKEVVLDPYILGLWLGDGLSKGNGFAINEEMDEETREYIIEWGKNNDATFTLNSKSRTLTCTSTTNKHKHGLHPLRKLLNQYKLIDNKHIPKEYMLNDRETRLKVLAGFIDTDGTAMRDGTRIVISQGMNHEKLMHELVFLVRSLGFACSLTKKKTTWTYKGEKKTGEALIANISGEGLEEIPTLLPRKKCASPKSINTSKTTGKISIMELEEGDFVGIEIDGNQRFAINDFTITHNCSNIFSSMFSVEVYNKDAGKIYTQVWRDNMYKKDSPVYKTKGFPKTIEDGKNGYTMVEFIPDFKRFGVEGFTDDIMAFFEKLIYDTAMTVSLKGVKVIYNGSLVPINNIKDYVKLYFDEEPKEMMTLASKDCKVVVCPNNEFTHVSFVNGIYTKDGGVHVKKWSDTIFKPISEKINTTLKDKSIDISHVKKHFFVFIYADVSNPLFGNQNKTRFDGPAVEADLKEAELKKLMKWDFVDKIKDSLKSKEINTLKNETERKRGMVNVEGLKDANFAGKKGKNTDCVLCVTEGDSANTYAIAGMKYGLKFGDKEVKGRDYIGSLPIRGKFLNVRNASIQSLLKNSEVKSLIQALGLQYDVDYSNDENYKKLRYGKLMSIVDADVDGFHITGLLFNFIHSLFPSLAKRKGFFNLMRIPIIKISGKHNKSFFSQQVAEEYIEKNKPKKDDIKYFKGLGTAQDEDIEEDFGRRIVEFEVDEKGDEMMSNIFGKENADFRKDWIMNYKYSLIPEGKDYTVEDLKVTDFLNNEMILFSIDDCKRSIPSMIDGLKESQRKILFSAFKRRLLYNDKSIKVAQFSGYVAEHSSYHHGEQNLVDTTIKLAQTFVGSNNIPLFFNEGQFGCLSPDTLILTWNGSVKRADTIVVGDRLIGDDGNIRNVLKTTSGFDNMFEIITENNNKYTINSQHILTLWYSENYKIIYKPSTKSINFNYFNGREIKSFGVIFNDDITNKDHHNKSKITKEEAFNIVNKKREELMKLYGGSLNIDIKLTDYMSLSKHNKKKLYMVSNTECINWDKKDVPIDPYILGIWLGDGNHEGKGITSIDEDVIKAFALYADTINCELIHDSNYGRTNENYHYGIRRKSSGKKSSIGDDNHSSSNCIGCKTSNKYNFVCDWKFNKTEPIVISDTAINGMKREDLNPWTQILKKNNLYKNKHIPDAYKYNDKETRLQLLAGFIDTDGTVKKTSRTKEGNFQYYIEISQSERLHKELIYSLEYISKSLGYSTFISRINNTKLTKKGEDTSILCLRIHGRTIHEIPTKLQRKKIPNTTEVRVKKYHNYSKFKINPIGKGKFYGWSIDGNERFLLGDFIVTHNSRVKNGDDAASGRYLFTKLNLPTRTIFRPEDDDFLKDRTEEGETVEKEFYVPIVPMILVNGCSAGIGSGFSSSIPSYKIEDIITQINNWLDRKDGSLKKVFDEIKPWYRGFNGNIVVDGKKIITEGVYEKIKEKTYKVTELPIGKSNISIDKYEEFLKKLQEEKKITSFSSNCTESIVDFTINVADDFEVSHKSLNLTDNVYTSNMVLFDPSNKIKKYESVQDILEEFCNVRYSLYEVRKEGIVKSMEEDLLYIRNKIKFIGEIINNTISLKERDDESLNKELITKKYSLKEGSYDYLLNIQVRSMTSKRVNELKDKEDELKKQLENYKKKSIKDIWKGEMDELIRDYNKWLEFENGRKVSKKKAKKAKK